MGHSGFPTVTIASSIMAVNAKNHGKMKKYSAFQSSLALHESHGIDDNAKCSSITVLLSNGALHYIVEITDLPYAFLESLLLSTERCLKYFLDVLSKLCHEFCTSFLLSFKC